MAEHQATRLEAARTNSLTRSEEFDHGDWVKTNVTVNADQKSGPDGVVSLDEIVENNDTSNSHRIEQNKTLTADATYAFSCWAIEGDRKWLALLLGEDGATSNRVRTWFNLADGTVGTSEGKGTGSHARSYVEDWTDAVPGLYRCVVVGSVGNGATNIVTWVQMTQSDGQNAYDGDGSSSLYAGYTQLEDDSAFASSYIATTSSAVTRAADDLSWGYTADPQEATLYGKLNLRHIDTLGSLVHIGDETDGMRVEVDASNNLVAKLFDGGSTASSSVAIGHSFDDTVEWRAVYESDGGVTAHAAVNGGSESSGSTDSSQSLPSSFGSANITIGAEQDGTNPCNGDYLAFQKSPGDRTLAEIQSLAGVA